MADHPSSNKAEPGRKATSKSASGRKSHQPSQSVMQDLQRCQKALEQNLQVEKDKVDPKANSITIRSEPLDQGSNDDLDLSRALSPERTDQQFASSPYSKERPKGDPFDCSITSQDPPPATSTAQRSTTSELEDLPEPLQQLIARAISHGIVTGIREHRSASLVSESLHSRRSRVSPSTSLTGSPERSPTRSGDSANLGLEDEPWRDTDLSNDKGAPPDVPAFMGLFQVSAAQSQSHIRSLRSSTMASTSAPTGHGIFSETVAEQFFIPAPKLFTDVVWKQWSNPASLPIPSGTDRHNFNMEPSLANLLQVPTVDGPVAALSSPSPYIYGDISEGLKPEDKKFDLSFKKVH